MLSLCHSYCEQLIQQPTTAHNKIQFMTNINLIHVSAPECHPQGGFHIKEMQTQHVNLGTATPLLE
jgi:hypothetical protein